MVGGGTDPHLGGSWSVMESRSTVVLHVHNPRKAKLLLPRTHYHNALLFSRLPLIYFLGTTVAARNHGKATVFQLTPKPAIDFFCSWFFALFFSTPRPCAGKTIQDASRARSFERRRLPPWRRRSPFVVSAASDCRGKQQQAGVTGAGGRAAAAVEPEQVAA